MLARLDLNRASIEGPAKFPWWKDWRGKACAIVASGPSAKTAGVEKLRGRLPVIAIKENAHELCKWADVAYGCDLAWWEYRRGLADFKGLKIGWDQGVRQFPGVQTITIKTLKERPVQYSDELQVSEPGVIGGGGNSGFQAFNLAVQFGASRILLVGFDMHSRSGPHWYGRNGWMKANNPDEANFRKWRRAFDGSVGLLRELDVDVVNAAPFSELKSFRRLTVDQTLNAWGLSDQ